MSKSPDIYIVGVQKSGTTTLYDWLAQHPQIYGPPLAKDYPYFSNDRVFREGRKQFESFYRNVPKNHLSLGGDANAMYAPVGPRRMHEYMPQARLIAILRNPVERAYSAYCYAVERVMEDRGFAQAIQDEIQGYVYSPNDAHQRDYLGHGRYATQLERVFHNFPRDQVKVLLFEELRDDPHVVLRDVFQWLNIDPDFQPDLGIRNKTQGAARIKWLAKLIHFQPRSSWIRAVGRGLIPFPIRTQIRRKLAEFNRAPGHKPELYPEVRQQLQEYYRPEIVRLEALLGREINCW